MYLTEVVINLYIYLQDPIKIMRQKKKCIHKGSRGSAAYSHSHSRVLFSNLYAGASLDICATNLLKQVPKDLYSESQRTSCHLCVEQQKNNSNSEPNSGFGVFFVSWMNLSQSLSVSMASCFQLKLAILGVFIPWGDGEQDKGLYLFHELGTVCRNIKYVVCRSRCC